MRFTLHYRGRLKSAASPVDKQALRRHFHVQLCRLWNETPLTAFQEFLKPNADPGSLSAITEANGFQFAHLICERLGTVAELEVLLLWPQPPGAIVSAGGDIDNRLKTLFDALRAPREATALPTGEAPRGDDEVPFFVLLEDDRLITRVTVETAQLLEPSTDPAEVELWLRVRVRQVRTMMGTLGLTS